jgi:Uma2 family endonuclease
MVVAQRHYTVDEWLNSPQNTALSELVDGIPIERMTTSGDHGEVAGVLWDWLRTAQRAGLGQAYAGPTGVLLDPDGARNNVREPDLCSYRQGRDIPGRLSKGIEGVPDFVIEILSPGNEDEDLPGGSVWNSYERFGVPRYWIVDLNLHTVTQYEPQQGHFIERARLHAGDALICPLFPDLPLSVADLFAEIMR